VSAAVIREPAPPRVASLNPRRSLPQFVWSPGPLRDRVNRREPESIRTAGWPIPPSLVKDFRGKVSAPAGDGCWTHCRVPDELELRNGLNSRASPFRTSSPKFGLALFGRAARGRRYFVFALFASWEWSHDRFVRFIESIPPRDTYPVELQMKCIDPNSPDTAHGIFGLRIGGQSISGYHRRHTKPGPLRRSASAEGAVDPKPVAI
jgi:hypothetical protein